MDRGGVVCLLGPNGAGKTTTVRICSTLLLPTTGSVTVAGIDAVKRPKEARRQLGLVLGGERGFYVRATALENLRFFADLSMLDYRSRTARIQELLELVGLEGRERDKVETYSRGMRQRLHIARALLANPPLLLLDEPTSGLDPEGALQLRELVIDLKSAGHGIVLTTHMLHEAQAVADQIVVITSGRITARGTVADIASLAGVQYVTTIHTDGVSTDVLTALRDLPGVSDVQSSEQGGQRVLVVAWATAHPDEQRAVAILGQDRIELAHTRPATLEEAYLAFVAAERRREGVEAP